MDIVMRKTARGVERPVEKDFRGDRKVVRVLPTRDDIRRYIKHPISNVRFPHEGSVEWPFDQFTKRRIADGDVTIEKPAPVEQQQKKLEPPAKQKESAAKPYAAGKPE